VYATTLTVDGIIRAGITNIGVRPTFGESDVAIETHLLGYDAELYGRAVRLSFVQRLRDERRFPDVDALRAQIQADQRRAERLFDRISV
jgi:riboflavin kinase/FMN adenylyltransferase